MRKLGLFVVALFVALPILLVTLTAGAADIPASASGTYRALPGGPLDGYQCDISAYQIADGTITNRALRADCQAPTGRFEGSATTYDACPSTAVTQPPMRRVGEPCGPPPYYCVPPDLPRFSLLQYQPATAQCTLGQALVTIGNSPPTVMCRTQIIVATQTYPGCNEPPPPAQPPTPPRRKYPPWFCALVGQSFCT